MHPRGVGVLLDELEAVLDLHLATRLEDDQHVDLLVDLAARRFDDQLAVAREANHRALTRAEVDLRVARTVGEEAVPLDANVRATVDVAPFGLDAGDLELGVLAAACSQCEHE